MNFLTVHDENGIDLHSIRVENISSVSKINGKTIICMDNRNKIETIVSYEKIMEAIKIAGNLKDK